MNTERQLNGDHLLTTQRSKLKRVPQRGEYSREVIYLSVVLS